jgi:hypothetical protein
VISASTGATVPGVGISLIGAGQQARAMTDAEGRFHFDHLGRDRYGLMIDQPKNGSWSNDRAGLRPVYSDFQLLRRSPTG